MNNKELEAIGLRIRERRMALDLTQTSFSTIPSIDLEVGNAVSHSDACFGIFTKLIEEGFPVFSEAKPFSLK